MRQIYVSDIENTDGNLSIRHEDDEIVIAITEEELIIAVDALWARAAEVKQRQIHAMRVEGETPHSGRVDLLSDLTELYGGLGSTLTMISNRSWTSSDRRDPEREVYELAERKLQERKDQASISESASTSS